ncbi:MAG: MliC family protein [Paracoccus sp. (in: a-proteobacteria)]|uniref:MliC family protein n=1 Tax=Paracoccus sp. TaxID=267 RepID=UPI0026DF405B|nr:MliC family protein [Paracoccus sp. (in: a-proteobacteria)]MDO5632290.1 MliC family protein [Paracoccus sp. (in: a-proteobacteria)]
MTARFSLLAALLAASPALALAQEQTNRPEDGAFISQVVFTCERGTQVPVAYVLIPTGESFAVAHIDGQQIAMIQVVSGSGVRYRSVDEAHPYELHAKGDDGMFFYGPDGDAADLLTECRVSET